MTQRNRAIAVLASLCAAACQGSEARSDRLASRSSAIVSDNGRSMNGRSMNGRSMNGRSMNGRSMNGRSMNGRSLDGLLLESLTDRGVTLGDADVVEVSLSATVFSGWLGKKTAKAPQVAGTDFVGTVWQGELSDGTTIPVRIEAIAPLPTPNADLLGYAISYQTDEGWLPFCGYEGDGSPTLAIPMPGVWNYDAGVAGAGRYDDKEDKGYTFACRHAAIAKCVELGYRPWAKVEGKSLRPLTVACTRMLRADYCGTGVSYTLDGTLIDIDDDLGIQRPAEPSWAVEAEWGENGAVCVSPGSSDRFTNTALMPPCYSKLSSIRDCGGRRDGPTLLVNRYAAPGQERFTGTWYGKAEGHGWGRIWMTLRQDGDSIVGSYVTDKAERSGSVTGSVLGRSVELTVSTTERKTCTGLLTGSAFVDASSTSLALDASGKGCNDPLTVELTKQ